MPYQYGKLIGHISGGSIPKIFETPLNTTIGGGNLRPGEMLKEQVSATSKRAGNMDSGQVSAKSKPPRCLGLLKRNDGPKAMKEDGRNDNYAGNTAW